MFLNLREHMLMYVLDNLFLRIYGDEQGYDVFYTVYLMKERVSQCDLFTLLHLDYVHLFLATSWCMWAGPSDFLMYGNVSILPMYFWGLLFICTCLCEFCRQFMTMFWYYGKLRAMCLFPIFTGQNIVITFDICVCLLNGELGPDSPMF